MTQFLVVLCGKINHIAQLAYLNHRVWTRLLSLDEVYTGGIRKIYLTDEDHLDIKIVAFPMQSILCLYTN